MILRITIAGGADTRLQSLMRMFAAAGMSELHRAAGTEVQVVTAAHISVLAATRHTTANKLGASPTNHFAQAAEKVAAPAALTSDASSATLTINHPGFTRAFRNVTITPDTAQSLAIPIHAASYGRKASELWSRFQLFIPKGKAVIAATINGVFTPMYWLTKRVTQKQDRSLLPSDAQFRDAAMRGAKGWLGQALAKKGNL